MKIGFVGAGKMAQALTRGFLAAGTVAAENISASAPARDSNFIDDIKSIIQQLGITTTHNNSEIAEKNDVIFLAVKPPLITKVASEIAPHVNRNKLIVSIAMGINIRTIESLLPSKSRVVRVMPNTPSVVRSGTAGFSMGGACLEGDSDTVRELLSAVGYAVELPENLIDPVTGLSASGVSYMFVAMEAMTDAGIKLGIPRELSLGMAAHTLLGAANMALKTNMHPAQLKDDVQSPGGCTVYGGHILERAGFRGILMDAIIAAAERSRETGEGSSRNNRD